MKDDWKIVIKSMISLSFILILSNIEYCFGCTCAPPKKPEMVIDEIKSSKEAFIGEVIYLSVDSHIYKVRVKESFKGEFKEGDILIGYNLWYCTPNVFELGDWIMYGRFNGLGFEVNPCGFSRSLEHPENNRHFRYSSIPILEEENGKIFLKPLDKAEKLERMQDSLRIVENAFKYLEKEIEILRDLTPESSMPAPNTWYK